MSKPVTESGCSCCRRSRTAVNLLLLGFILVYASMLVEHYLEKHEGRSVWFGVVFYGVIFLLIAAVIYFKLLG
jgi:hypothetical protein